MIRTEAACSVSGFAELVGVRWRTYCARLARHRAGEAPKGPWPAPVVDRIEPTVAKYAADWPAWGYRKVRAIATADGHQVGSPSSVKRAMPRRGLLQPVRYPAERRQLAAAMLDRLLHRCTVINITGGSYRLRAHQVAKPGREVPAGATPR